MLYMDFTLNQEFTSVSKYFNVQNHLTCTCEIKQNLLPTKLCPYEPEKLFFYQQKD